MKVCLIKASADSDFKEYKASMGGPPQNIFAVAAATPDHVDIEMIDETIGKKINFKTNADLIAIFFSTPDAMRGYKIANTFKELGKTVVLGGLHPSFMVDEASAYADCIMIGEVENYWEELLTDFQEGNLRKTYISRQPVDLTKLRPYPMKRLGLKDYGNVWSIVVSRGCDHGCNYCVVNPFFKSCRNRPIKDIVAEIQLSGAKMIELHADNLIADRDYALALFKAIMPLNIQWIGEATITIAEDEELLSWAIKSGLTDLLVGLETPCQEALDNIGKSFIKVDKLKGYVDKIQSTGVKIDASFLFGFDEHHPDIFKKTLEFAMDVGIANCHAVILTPFPGTPFYKKIVKEDRLLTRDYSKFDCTHAVFQPKHMTAEELEQGALWFDIELEKALKRKKKTKVKDFQPVLSGKEPVSNQNVEMPSIDNIKMKSSKNIKWKSILGVILVLTATVFDLQILFGVFYIIWALMDLKSGYAFVFEQVSRRENKILYWLIVTIWLSSGIYIFTSALMNNWLATPKYSAYDYDYDAAVSSVEEQYEVDQLDIPSDQVNNQNTELEEVAQNNNKAEDIENDSNSGHLNEVGQKATENQVNDQSENEEKNNDVKDESKEENKDDNQEMNEAEDKKDDNNNEKDTMKEDKGEAKLPDILPIINFGKIEYTVTFNKDDPDIKKYDDPNDDYIMDKLVFITMTDTSLQNINDYMNAIKEIKPVFNYFKDESISLKNALENKKDFLLANFYTSDGLRMISVKGYLKDGSLTGKMDVMYGEFQKK